MEEKRLSLRENLASLDRLQFLSVLALFFLGVASIFSAGAGFDGRGSGFAARQLLWGCLSAVAYLGVLQVGYARFLSWAYRIYAFALVLLFGVMVLGMTVKGSQSWFHLGFFRF